MKIINETYPSLIVPDQLTEYSEPSKTLFFDIETTGLNKATTSLYLIGCGFYENNVLHTRFFFADSPSEEAEVLTQFFMMAREYNTVIHFNGTKFDLPYLDYKAQKYNIPNPLNSLQSIDIYKLIKPLRYILFRESMRQKCVEDFLGITRNDMYNGGELIEVYLSYVKSRSDEEFSLLMTHNREDVLGMHKMFPILNYLKLFDCHLTYQSQNINEYRDFNNNTAYELILTFSFEEYLPKSFSVVYQKLYFKVNSDNSTLCIRIPLISGVMNHYFDNYKDYVYLLKEKKCVHKSVASSVDKGLKTKANKDSCFVEVKGDYLPSMGFLNDKCCGHDYKSRKDYIIVSHPLSEDFANEYGNHLFMTLLNSKPRRHSQSCPSPINNA